MRRAMVHSRRRIVMALSLSPMSKTQLATCLCLHRNTIEKSLSDLVYLQKVVSRPADARHTCFGPPPLIFELRA